MNLEDKKSTVTEIRQKQSAAMAIMAEAGLEFAVMIALPLLGGIYGGKWLDQKTQHHFFIIIGILASLALSAMLVHRKINQIKNLLK